MGSPSSYISPSSPRCEDRSASPDPTPSSDAVDTPDSPSQDDILVMLGHSSTYGIDLPVDRLDRLESVLFFAGPYCYKIFRETCPAFSAPVTMNQRKALAEQELALGKQLTPELYHKVIPIRLDGSSLRLGDVCTHGRIVDWLIRLDRFEPSLSYDKQVAFRRPNFKDCAALASTILDSHDSSSSQPGEDWVHVLHERLEQFGPFVQQLHKAKDRCHFHACLVRAKARLELLATSLRRRQSRGMFHRLHGDLRLGNMLNGIDGPRLLHPACERTGPILGDPLYDLSSLLSELWSQGLRQQANWVFSHYCNSLSDEESLACLDALDLYIFLRSFEQARALCSLGGKNRGDEWLQDCQCGQHEDQIALLQTAGTSLLQDEAMVIVIGGGSAGDRSQLVRYLSPQIGRLPGALHLTLEANEHIWQIKTRQALQAGYCVILDGDFEREADQQALEGFIAGNPVHTNASSSSSIQPHLFWLDGEDAISRSPDAWLPLDMSLSYFQQLDRILSCVSAGPETSFTDRIH